MQQEAEQHADRAGDQADRGELQGEDPGQAPLRLTEHAQHRAVVEVAVGELARRQRDRDRRQQGGQQRHQVQELGRAVQRLAHLRPTGLQRLQPHAAPVAVLHLLAGLGGELLHRAARLLPLADHREAVGDTAGRLDQRGGGQVRLRQHHPRREVQEAGAAIWLIGDLAGDPQRRVAQQQRIADLQAQRAQHARVDPDRAGGRRAHLATILQGQHAPQRIARPDRLDRHQAAAAALVLAGARHAGEVQRLDAAQVQSVGQLPHRDGRRLITRDDRVTAQQLGRVASQPLVQPVGQEGHRAHRGHRQHQGQDQQVQLAGACIAPGLQGHLTPEGRRPAAGRVDGGSGRGSPGCAGGRGRRMRAHARTVANRMPACCRGDAAMQSA